jgi:hypothetical protein
MQLGRLATFDRSISLEAVADALPKHLALANAAINSGLSGSQGDRTAADFVRDFRAPPG